MVDAQCPYCFETDEVPDGYAGRVHKCLTCGKTFTIKFVPALLSRVGHPRRRDPKKSNPHGIAVGQAASQPQWRRTADRHPIAGDLRRTDRSGHGRLPRGPSRKSDPREPGLVDELNSTRLGSVAREGSRRIFARRPSGIHCLRGDDRSVPGCRAGVRHRFCYWASASICCEPATRPSPTSFVSSSTWSGR